MTKARETLPEFQPGRGYTQADWDAVSDSPELTDEEFANMKPAREVLPAAFFERLQVARAEAEDVRRGRGRPKSDAAKVAVTLRMEPSVVERFKAGGGDWRKRMQEALRKASEIEA